MTLRRCVSVPLGVLFALLAPALSARAQNNYTTTWTTPTAGQTLMPSSNIKVSVNVSYSNPPSTTITQAEVTILNTVNNQKKTTALTVGGNQNTPPSFLQTCSNNNCATPPGNPGDTVKVTITYYGATSQVGQDSINCTY
jgi:hypothetical protein